MLTTIVILAAGASSRMGKPKQRLEYRGRTLLGHACEVARVAAPDSIVVVLGHRSAELRQFIPAGVKVVVNPNWFQGLSSSIRAALESMGEEVEVLVLCLADQPQITAEHLRRLASGVSEESPIAASIYPEGHPGVPAAFHRSVFPELMALRGDAGAKAVLQHHANVTTVPAPSLIDVDTQADYERLLACDEV